MNIIDIRTLVIIITVSSLLQVIALFLQYRVNKTTPGIGWWLLGFTSMAIGYGFLFLRDIVPIRLITIIFANALVLSGLIFIYIGILRFLNKKENRSIVIFIFTVFILSFFYYTYFDNNITLRTVIIYSALAAISLFTAQILLFNKAYLVTTALYFNTALFLINGCYFAFRAVFTLTVDPVSGLFNSTVVQTVSFLFLFVQGILLTFGLIIMVNERLNAENREARENLELIFNTIPDAVLVTRWTEDYSVDLNEGFTALTGYTRAEVIGKSSRDINIWKNPAERQQFVTSLKEKGFCENLETGFRHKDGSQLTAIMSAKIITLQGIPHIICVVRDITERKQADEYREMGREILQILNEPGDLQESISRVLAALKTRTGFDAVGIRLQDGDDFPYFVQQGFSDDFLLTENTLVERAADGGVCRDKDGNASLECTCGLVISGKTDPLNPLFTERGSAWTNDSFPILDIPIGDDPRHNPRNHCIHQGYASIALIPIRSQDRIVGLIQLNDRHKGRFTIDAVEALEGIASHIGSALMRKQAETALRASEDKNRQLQKTESLSRMAGAIAHNFNNQLGVVMGNLELALLELPKGTRPQANITTAMKASSTAAQMSSLMLTYLGQSFDKREPLDLSEACRRNLPELQGVIPENIVLETDLALPGPAINTNTKHIEQVLTNLVTNAQESIGKNRGIITLRVKTVSRAQISAAQRFPLDWQPQGNAYACLEVTDTGCGIADKDIEKLFDPFYSSKFTGRGMGLPVVMGIVRVHGGVITVESRPGQGSTFLVFFPLSEQEVAPQPEKAD